MPELRATLAESLIGMGRSVGQSVGLELVVEVSDHSIELGMEEPNKTARAWDSDLYSSGNVFVSGYANPIKPRVEYRQELEEPDTVDVTEGDTDEREGSEDEAEDEDEQHVQLISSGRYRDYMRQDLISQLLTPDAQWRTMVYAVIAVAALQFISIIVTLYATGTFA